MDEQTEEAVGGFRFNRTDGGRVSVSERTREGKGDCVIRALAIATKTPYAEVAKEMIERRLTNFTEKAYNINHGSCETDYAPFLLERGWRQIKVKTRTTHARKFTTLALAKNKAYVVEVNNHLVAVVDGVFNDTWDSRFNRNDIRLTRWAKKSSAYTAPEKLRIGCVVSYWVFDGVAKPKRKPQELVSGLGFKKTSAGRVGRLGTNDSIVRALSAVSLGRQGYKWAMQGLQGCRKEGAKHLEPGARVKNIADGTPKVVYNWWFTMMDWEFISFGPEGKPLSELELSKFRQFMVVLANDYTVAVVKGVLYDTTDSRLNAIAYGYWRKV